MGDLIYLKMAPYRLAAFGFKGGTKIGEQVLWTIHDNPKSGQFSLQIAISFPCEDALCLPCQPAQEAHW